MRGMDVNEEDMFISVGTCVFVYSILCCLIITKGVRGMYA